VARQRATRSATPSSRFCWANMADMALLTAWMLKAEPPAYAIGSPG
jgi:hypothetical protein